MKFLKVLLAAAITAIAITVVAFLVIRLDSQGSQALSQISTPRASPTPSGKPLGSIASAPPSVPPPSTNTHPPIPTDGTRTYRLHIMDESKTPISNAAVVVEILQPKHAKRSGRTNIDGVFEFAGDISSNFTQVSLTVDAQGFLPLQEYSPLIEDRAIQLSKVK